MKNTLSLLFFLFIGTPLSAQDLSFGIEAGVISSINSFYSPSNFANRRNTYFSGLNANYNFNQSISATTGIHYLRQGSKGPTPDCWIYNGGGNRSVIGKNDYLVIPFILNFHLGKTKRFLASLGLYGGYNIKAAQDYPEPKGGCDLYLTPDVSEITEDLSFGGLVGVGYRVFENDKLQITPVIRYYQGVSNTISKTEYIKAESRNSSGVLSLNFNYKIAR